MPAGPHRRPTPAALRRLSGRAVIDALATHWLHLSKRERDAYTHVLLDHPDRVAIFDVVFRRAEQMRRRAKN
jgi:hypothetical protein